MSHQHHALRSPIGAWLEFYNQRDFVEQLKKDGHTPASLLEREKRKLQELHEKALNKQLC